ncbi:SCH9_2 [Sanghuangporus sanghuang]
MGMVEVRPDLKRNRTVSRWYNLLPRANAKFSAKPSVCAPCENPKPKRALTPGDFEFLGLIGRGTFGRVFQVRKKDTQQIYAMKVVSKKKVIASREVTHTLAERNILQQSQNSPFLVGLKFSFQTDTELFLGTEFKNGGELFWHLQKEVRFGEEKARFYVAELVLALEHLHKYDIVYRDLKPENILLDATGHIALCDFGLSKLGLKEGQLTNTFCGTSEYLAPEMLVDERGHSKLVDFWSLGVLLFEMCFGWSPFYSEDKEKMYENICFAKIKFPKNVLSTDAKQFVKGLLTRNPKQRLGAQRDTEELKEHAFFKSFDWEALAEKRVTPPFLPSTESDESTENFDPAFTSIRLSDSGDIHHTDRTSNGVALECEADLQKMTTLCKQEVSVADRLGATVKGWRSRLLSEPVSSPINESAQEMFRGFSFSGESTVTEPTRNLGEPGGLNGSAVDEGYSSSSENDFNDDRPTGRIEG